MNTLLPTFVTALGLVLLTATLSVNAATNSIDGYCNEHIVCEVNNVTSFEVKATH